MKIGIDTTGRDFTDIQGEALRGAREISLKRMLEGETWREIASRIESFEPTVLSDIDLSCGTVQIGLKPGAICRDRLAQTVEELVPWRKGPFSFHGLEIDSEWRSNLKWDRLRPALGDLRGKRIADVGAGNGYYLFRAANDEPEIVVGFDPYVRPVLQFALAAQLSPELPVALEPLRSDALRFFPEFFDVVLCAGVIYHVRRPLTLLAEIRGALKPGGVLVLESQGIAGESEEVLVPEGRYAKARNVYFVPTVTNLTSWLHGAGFEEVKHVSIIAVTFDEQRRTRFAPGESLKNFLNPDDPSLTVEGYPAPHRIILSAKRP